MRSKAYKKQSIHLPKIRGKDSNTLVFIIELATVFIVGLPSVQQGQRGTKATRDTEIQTL
jgi:hypothetical protein